VLKSLLAAAAGIAVLCPAQARDFQVPRAAGEPPWVFEFEFTYGLDGYLDRLLLEDCGVVVPPQYVQYYASDPRPGWTIACGNEQPMFTSFLGRRCAQIRRVEITCGWRHFSSPGDSHELTFDAFSIRGRITFGRGRG
jgi:hypothetical protein